MSELALSPPNGEVKGWWGEMNVTARVGRDSFDLIRWCNNGPTDFSKHTERGRKQENQTLANTSTKISCSKCSTLY